jgi:hypothetical protein
MKKKSMPKAQVGKGIQKVGKKVEQVEKKVGSTARGLKQDLKKADDYLEKRYPNAIGKNPYYQGAKKVVKTALGMKKKGGSTKKK